MHGAVALFRLAMEIGAGKSVSFFKKNSVRFENGLQKVLEIKKIYLDDLHLRNLCYNHIIRSDTS
jgi:hypothetical protein